MADAGPVQVAEVVARFLQEHGVDRVFGLQGGHIQPIWDQLARCGVRIVDVRDEGSAVHMAHAHTELTGQTAVAMVTAGPGVTNTVTAVANASVSRIPLLVIGGCPPIPQSNMGPLQDIPHTAILEPVTRLARTLRSADQVLREFDEAWARASGDRGEPGPVYLEIPTDVLRQEVPPALVTPEHLRAKPKRRPQPHPEDVAAVADLIRAASKPAIISGRGARQGGEHADRGTDLVRLLDASGAAYLDTQESRGLVPDSHPAAVGSARSAVMRDTDLLITVGRQLDYQLGMGSPAVFTNAKIVRISDTASELIDNRRGEVEILAEPGAALGAIADALKDHTADTSWRDELKAKHRKRSEDYRQALHTTENGADGHIHPNRIFGALDSLDGDALDLGEAVMIADGGDLLSFARLGITRCARYLDAGAFGCLGVATPFAIAASLAYPDRPVVAVTGDGAFGITATDIDTAVRHGAKIVVIVSNNRAWNIERYDQAENYGLVVGTDLADSDYAGLARAFGAHGERVTDAADLEGAIRRAVENAPAVVDVVTTQDAPSPDSGKGLGFVPDYQALTPWNDAEVARRKEGTS
ncbi:thiamine pyrophosphate-binding protein [Actinomycetospora endophytica]|uniref:Thiamine pyrophosphate-binding protein n=1 Tax=Actinomycetospora endophytica TaxID=2291215 RepID=A0ABS8PDG1_9PSEU|nr:thiamine pyrophosphate-binding protein [Actinomycetospora endophytica]MCD2196320.1 thiamine pyrophosphate-binding protein [Actinomycetospora endophytica]